MGDSGVWDDLLNAALIYASQQGKNGGTPNFYNVPMSPEMKAAMDEIMKAYKEGGSPNMKMVSGAGMSFLGGMPTTAPNHSFLSPLMQGQKFAGGIEIPKIDFSKLPTIPGTKPDGPAAPGPPKDQDPGPERPSPRDLYGWTGKNDDTNKDSSWAGLPLPDMIGGERGGPGAREAWQKVSSAWNQWKAEHPNWAKLGVNAALTFLTATTGLAGAAIMPVLRNLLLRDPAVRGGGGTIPGSIVKGGQGALPGPTGG